MRAPSALYTAAICCLTASVAVADPVPAEVVASDLQQAYDPGLVPVPDGATDQPAQFAPGRPPAPERYLELEGRTRTDSTDRAQWHVGVATPLNDTWGLQADWRVTRQDEDMGGPPSGLAPAGAPPAGASNSDDAQLARLTLSRRTPRGEWRFGTQAGKGTDRYYGALLGQRLRAGQAWMWQWQATYHDEVRESPELQRNGMKNELMAGLDWRPDPRNTLSGQLIGQRFYTQDGDRLGKGQSLCLEAGRQLFERWPQHRLRLTVRLADYSADASAATGQPLPPPPPVGPPPPPGTVPPPPPAPPGMGPQMLPQDSHEYGLVWSYGLGEPHGQTELAWQPFAELGVSEDTERGGGYRYLLGAQGALGDNGRLTVGFEGRKNSQQGQSLQNNGAEERQLLARYRWLF